MNLAGFNRRKSVQEDSLLVQSKPKSTQYKDKWAVEVFRTWQAAREQKFCIRGFQYLKLVESIVFVFNLFCFDPEILMSNEKTDENYAWF